MNNHQHILEVLTSFKKSSTFNGSNKTVQNSIIAAEIDDTGSFKVKPNIDVYPVENPCYKYLIFSSRTGKFLAAETDEGHWSKSIPAGWNMLTDKVENTLKSIL